MRVERIGDATLYCGDCRDILPTLVGIEGLITDPPYGIGWMPRVTNREAIIGDELAFRPLEIIGLVRSPIPLEIIMWGANHYASDLPPMPPTRWLMWLKHDPSLFGTRGHSPFELAWTNLEGSDRAFRWIWDGSIRQGASSAIQRIHPAEKPEELMRWCIEFTKSTTILDPFMGSGTTGVACARLGRRFIGVEIEEKYFTIACRRIEQAQRQGDMFVPRVPAPKQPELL